MKLQKGQMVSMPGADTDVFGTVVEETSVGILIRLNVPFVSEEKANYCSLVRYVVEPESHLRLLQTE